MHHEIVEKGVNEIKRNFVFFAMLFVSNKTGEKPEKLSLKIYRT